MSRLVTALLERWTVVVRRRQVVKISVIACVITAVVLSMSQPTVYESSVDLLAPPRTSTRVLADSPASLTGADLQRATNNELAVIEGDVVRTAVQQSLNLAEAPERPDATAVRRTDIIRITVRNADPASAAALAQAYADTYIDVRRQQVTEELTTATEQLGTTIADLQQQLADTPETSADRPPLVGRLEAFQLTLEHLNLELVSRTSGVTLVSPAVIPADPVAPRPWQAGVVALLVGLVIGVAAALGLDRRFAFIAVSNAMHHDHDDISAIDNDDVINMFADDLDTAPGDDLEFHGDLDAALGIADSDLLLDLSGPLGTDPRPPETVDAATSDDATPVHGIGLPDTLQVPVVPPSTAPAAAPARRPKNRKGRR